MATDLLTTCGRGPSDFHILPVDRIHFTSIIAPVQPAAEQSGKWGMELKAFSVEGEVIYLVDGVDHTGEVKQFGAPKNQLDKLWLRGSNVVLAQFLGIVVPGLVLAEHVFRGLKRPLCDGEDMNADRLKLVLSWRPAFDYWWSDTNRFDDSKLEMREAPDGKVFAVIVTPNGMKDKFPSVDYWIERGFWVRRSNTLLKAPIDWENRYVEKLK